MLFSFSGRIVHWAASSLVGIAYSTSGWIGVSVERLRGRRGVGRSGGTSRADDRPSPEE